MKRLIKSLNLFAVMILIAATIGCEVDGGEQGTPPGAGEPPPATPTPIPSPPPGAGQPPPVDLCSREVDKEKVCFPDLNNGMGCAPGQFCCANVPIGTAPPCADPPNNPCGPGSFDDVCKVPAPAPTPTPVPGASTRKIKFINNCDTTVWVGAITNTRSGGWEMPESCSQDSDCSTTCTNAESAGITGATCTCNSNDKCQVDLDYPTDDGQPISKLSGRFWPRTGCGFVGDSCPPVDNNPFNCCDTGGCETASGFGLQCTGGGIAPTTVAEFTLQSGANNNDFYDVSVIDGFNVPVEMKPDELPNVPGNFPDPKYWCGNGGGRTPTTGLPGCTWNFGNNCAGNPEMRAVGVRRCIMDSECGSGNCNSSGACECTIATMDTDCNSGEICGVGSSQYIGFLACGKPVGCTTGKALCGVGPYFQGGIGGATCGQENSCASTNCLTNPPTPCTLNSDCDNFQAAVCREGMCQCTPNICAAPDPQGVRKCTNTGNVCSSDSDCTPTCTGECTVGPADFLDCPKQITTTVECKKDDDCPALVGVKCSTNSDCPPPTKCVDFGGKGRPGENVQSKVCQEPCVNDSCAGPTCTSDSDCITFNNEATGTFMLCDTAIGECVSTHASLFAAAGVNGQSCYIPYYNSQTAPSIACGGCPTECPSCSPPEPSNPNWPPSFDGDECRNNNPDWMGIVEPSIEGFKIACPTAYSFPFDDVTSTFQCRNEPSNTVGYTITFCPSS